MNFNFLALLGFIGSVICARVPFPGFAEFERKLSTAFSGECVRDIVDECENLPDYLDGMASKPANYVIPITDKYKLYNFFSGVISRYEKAEEDAGSTGFENANRIKRRIACFDLYIDERTKAHDSSLFRRMGKDSRLVEMETRRMNLQTELARQERASATATDALPKFHRFFNRFEPYKQREELLKYEEVTKALDHAENLYRN